MSTANLSDGTSETRCRSLAFDARFLTVSFRGRKASFVLSKAPASPAITGEPLPDPCGLSRALRRQSAGPTRWQERDARPTPRGRPIPGANGDLRIRHHGVGG